MEVPRIRTRTTDSKQHEEEMKVVRDFIENCLMERISKSEMLGGWQHWQLVYQLEVFGQEGSEVWSVDFEQYPPRVQKGDIGKINLYEGICLFRTLCPDQRNDILGFCDAVRKLPHL